MQAIHYARLASENAFSIKTEKAHTHLHPLGASFGDFLKARAPQFVSTTSETKTEAFLTHLAAEGVSAST